MNGAYDVGSGKCIQLINTVQTDWTQAYKNCEQFGKTAPYNYVGRLITDMDDSLWSFLSVTYNNELYSLTATNKFWIGSSLLSDHYTRNFYES
jgi:hypothetical protein